MSQDEIAVMDEGKCIMQVQGVRPFFRDKFDITKHPQYKYLLDSSKKNAFDIAKYLSRRLTVRPDDVYRIIMNYRYTMIVNILIFPSVPCVTNRFDCSRQG